MTQHPDFSRSSAHRRAARRTGKTGAVLLAVAALVGSTALPATATGPDRAPVGRGVVESVSAATAAEGTVDVSVIDISHPVAAPGDEVTVRARVTNGTDAVLRNAAASFTVDYLALTTRAEIAAWSDAALLDPVYGQPTQESVPRLDPGESATVSFTYNPGIQQLQGFGARRLAVAVGDATGRLGIARSFLVYDADGVDREPMNVSVLAAVTSPATDPADPAAAEIELAQQTATGQRLDGVLQVAEDATLSLAVDPDLMGAAATSGDADLRDWYERMLAAAERTTTYTLPDHDPDIAALAHANVVSTGPRSFVHGPRTGAWEVPEAWHTNLSWPAEGVAPDVETLDLAVATGRSNVVVGDGGLAHEGAGTVTGRAEVATPSGAAHAVLTDVPLTEAFLAATDLSAADVVSAEGSADTTEATTATTAAEGAQRLLAETAAVVSQSPADPPSLSIVAPRSWTPDAEAATTVLDTLDDAAWVSTTTLDALFREAAPEVPRTPLRQHERAKAELAATDVAALEHARDAIITFSSVAGENHPVIWRPGVRRLVAPLSVARRADPGLREQVVQQVLQETNETTKNSVTVVPRQEINFITDVGDIPVRVRNELGVDATVTVVLRPDHPRLTVDERSTETVPAGQEMDVQVPVRAIGSGDVEVTAQVLTPTGARISDESSFQVRVRAGWEEVGTWIAAGLVALLFLAGIWRTVRRGRSPNRATREDVEEATGMAAEAPETAPAPAATGVAAVARSEAE